eukprot:4485545-Prymnesium_polylepis.2
MGYSVRTAAYRYTRWERWNDSFTPRRLPRTPADGDAAPVGERDTASAATASAAAPSEGGEGGAALASAAARAAASADARRLADTRDTRLPPRVEFWAVGRGELLAEELYNHTANVGVHTLTGEFEAVNLADAPAAQQLKRLLARALEVKPRFIVL